MEFKLFAFILLFGFVSAATWMKMMPTKPKEFAHLEGCYIEEINDLIPFGVEVTPLGMCTRIACERRYIDYASCAVVDPGPYCDVSDGDLTRPYPECCHEIICDGTADNHL